MIQPTIGRKVWLFYRTRADAPGTVHDETKPFDVNIVYVWSDTCINVAGYDHDGKPFRLTSININVDGGGGSGLWCEWMPYQQGQAKAAEATPSA